MINANIILFDSKKTHICIIGDILHGDGSHQPGKKSQC
jgi:hypothetical protein